MLLYVLIYRSVEVIYHQNDITRETYLTWHYYINWGETKRIFYLFNSFLAKKLMNVYFELFELSLLFFVMPKAGVLNVFGARDPLR